MSRSFSFSFFLTFLFLFLSFVTASHPFQRLADSSTGGTSTSPSTSQRGTSTSPSTSQRAQLASADIVLNQGSSVAVGDIDVTLRTRNADLSAGDTISITLPGYSGVTGDADVNNVGMVSWNQITHTLNINLTRSFPTSTSEVKITIPTSVTSTWNLKSPVMDAGRPTIGLKLANRPDTVVYVNPTTAPLPSGTTCTLQQADGQSITFANGQTLVVGCRTCECKDTVITCTPESCGGNNTPPGTSTTQTPGTSINIGTDTNNLPSRCTPGDAVIIIGCNKCTCLPSGDRICAYQLGCVNPPTQAATPTQISGVCTYDGKEYAIRSVWNATDGCNACTCSSTLRVVCTVSPCDTIITATAAPVITPLPPTSLPVPETPTGLPIAGTGNGIGVAGTNDASHIHPMVVTIITLMTMIITIVTHL